MIALFLLAGATVGAHANAAAPALTAASAHKPMAPVTRATSRASLTKGHRIPVSQLIEDLSAPTVASRVAALKGLALWGPAAASAVPAIINALNDNRACGFGALSTRISPEVTNQVLNCLKAIGPSARSAAPYLVTMLTDRNELFRMGSVMDTLLSTGLDDSAASTIVHVAKSEGKLTQTRTQAIRLLGIIDPPSVEAKEVLLEIVQDRNDKPSRDEAIKSLAIISDRTVALEKLAPLKKPEDVLQLSELRAALAIAPSNTLKSRIDAVKHASELGTKAASLVPYLIQILTSTSTKPELSLECCKALGGIGPEAVAALPALVSKLMSEHDELDRGAICRAITSVDPQGKRTIPLIMPALEDPFRARITLELLDEISTGQSTALALSARKRWHMK